MEVEQTMRDTLFLTLLFDFYGDLLTTKQRDYYDLHYNQDLTLQEIAEQNGVSRQSVWDMIRRAEQSLREFEEKTGLVAKMLHRREVIGEIREILSRLRKKAEIERVIALLDSLDE